MSDKFPSGVLPKPEVLEKYRKPERTFQRRLSKALRLRNEDFLKHFYLSTSDGKLRDGNDVADGEVERLKGEGLYPVWGVEEDWFRDEYDQSSPAKPKSRTTEAPPAAPSLNHSTLDRPALVGEVESLRDALSREKQHNELLSQQLTIKDNQIKAANEIAMETNQREKEYSRLLKELTEVIKLAQGKNAEALSRDARDVSEKRASPTRDQTNPSVSMHPVVLDANVVTTQSTQQREGEPSGPAKKEPAKRQQPKSPITKRKATPRKVSKKSSITASKKSKKPTTQPAKPKWYQTPTIDRLLSRRK